MNASSRRRTLIAAGVLSVVILTGVGVAAWELVGGSTPPAAALSSSSPSQASAEPSSEAAGFNGTWSVDASSGSLDDGTSSYAGYRIEEELASIGANTAVGRTQALSGSMTIEGTEVSALEITVDMSTLRSDDERRDSQLADRGLDTHTFPTATFSLNEPVDIGSLPKQGEQINATAVGDLTLHGTTRQVEVPIQAQWTGERFEVIASFDVALSDYGIEAPTGFSVLSVADTGTIELHVLFQ